jgi:hypothetical protein
MRNRSQSFAQHSGLLENFSIDLLKFYINIEKPQYARETNDQVLAEIRSAWG